LLTFTAFLTFEIALPYSGSAETLPGLSPYFSQNSVISLSVDGTYLHIIELAYRRFSQVAKKFSLVSGELFMQRLGAGWPKDLPCYP
jgi:hypothetical protein